MYTAYVIRSRTTGKIYIGQTADWRKRLMRHNGVLPSRTRSYTKINMGPWEIVYNEKFTNRQDALKREKYLKSHHGRDWLREILGR
ncbi:MAG: hypothetical protein A3H50_00700 [Candidatus Levybacteria bacterium RIFCSPLOWO2_02_FULL_37_10]|uniref:GIY-YIG domain-containing protein n=1 Tax=Candidatus Blackburnbacteria bacterium RIFCSPLOWO2_01_FULL_41_27 TaxID=1797520 RepID=A0A1G1VCZ0_9BACT|nr:MAG: hypothetical protein A2860_04235 [Candidatus Levybacteria bacterium RIFCSPHIGHO2_01_FULL_37_33]OGH15849.1 MAG: hypothetical protein A3C97_00630 [Candidatus Levybacteria bacterium RIFCSPHIGHO2_02_FULL_37_11]OGH30151.1 MAG: hypothetical protein A3F30_00660 [Candidatus Levybacteria bacterium RIFCSPHIGHO2_12_FULL_37_12]OGH43258.1 MAG: hypothetical protein A3H50_00700 [Candidatus Levybacteria bacterium RIFCSPLOWO2_02_FULL_37_10]OGY13177.1 MAG: hypothetical protein A3A58_01990 [Candidatus Bla